MMAEEYDMALAIDRDNENQELLQENLAVMVFEAGSFTFAFDAEQVRELSFVPESITPEEIQSNRSATNYELSILPLRHILNEEDISLERPRLLLFNTEREQVALIVDEPRFFQRVPIQNIHIIPDLMTRFRGNKYIWGFYLYDEKIVFLIDLYRIKNIKS